MMNKFNVDEEAFKFERKKSTLFKNNLTKFHNTFTEHLQVRMSMFYLQKCITVSIRYYVIKRDIDLYIVYL